MFSAVFVLAIAIFAGGVVVAGGSAALSKANGNSSYSVHNLVSDGFLPADHTDPNLVNAWGITASSSSPWWVADNGMDASTLYNGDGVAQFPPTPLVVQVGDGPTGTVFNGGSGFVVSDGSGHSGVVRFMFATEGGTIRGWSPAVPPPPLSTQTFVGPNDADQSGTGAVFKGLAIAGDQLYATDFHNGRVDVFDSTFKLVTPPGAFTDPKLPSGYGPFGIQNIGGNIFVTYARQDTVAHDEVDGQGLGFVDEYSTAGTLLARVAQHGQLNAPWGLAMAPSTFGEFSGDLLVGNFGDGTINAYAPKNGNFVPAGQLRIGHGKPVAIDGLWGIGFGNGAASGPTNTLYFAAGTDHEAHGLFGRIDLTSDN
jgi:uncharacterized protein (TIGR03118 family)